MAKKKTYTAQTVETYQIISKVERRLSDLYGTTYQGVLQLAQVRRAIAAGEPFTFEPNRPETKALIKALDVLSQRTDRLLESSVSLAWQKGEESVTNTCYAAFGRTAAAKEAVRSIAERSREDLRSRGVTAGAYYTQKHGGLNISDRVWGNSLFAKQEIEEIIQQGILQGKTADEISRSVRGYLNNPSKLFRRVRNKETGALELSKNAKDYHPGRGVYRSSYQNAMRLARTEVNAAFRRAEWESYQNNPLITGYRIELSNNHTTTIKGKKVAFHDICDELTGEYPKTFQWTGWHPQCRCRMVPIFIKEGDFRSRIRALAAGKLDEWKASNTVTEPPKAFTDWVADNTERLQKAKQMPYFIADNYVGGDPTRGLVKAISGLKKQVQASKKIEPVTEWDHEIASLDRWAKAFELDTTQAKILRDAGDRKGLRAELDRLQQLRDDRNEAWSLENAKLTGIITKMEGAKFYDLAQQYRAQQAKYRTQEGVVWKDGIRVLKSLQGQALADLADAEEAKAKEPKKTTKPAELAEKGWFKEDDQQVPEEFWDLIDPDRPIKLEVLPKTPTKGGGCYYAPWQKKVYLEQQTGAKGRWERSAYWRRAVVAHEFGHGIDDQRKLASSVPVTSLMDKARAHMKEAVGYTEERIAKYNKTTGMTEWGTRKKAITRFEQVTGRLDKLYRRLYFMSDATWAKIGPKGVSRWDVIEAIAETQDTIMSLDPKWGWGHNKTYMRDPANRTAEFLAHCFEAKYVGNGILKHYMPEEYKLMVEYITSLKPY